MPSPAQPVAAPAQAALRNALSPYPYSRLLKVAQKSYHQTTSSLNTTDLFANAQEPRRRWEGPWGKGTCNNTPKAVDGRETRGGRHPAPLWPGVILKTVEVCPDRLGGQEAGAGAGAPEASPERVMALRREDAAGPGHGPEGDLLGAQGAEWWGTPAAHGSRQPQMDKCPCQAPTSAQLRPLERTDAPLSPGRQEAAVWLMRGRGKARALPTCSRPSPRDEGPPCARLWVWQPQAQALRGLAQGGVFPGTPEEPRESEEDALWGLCPFCSGSEEDKPRGLLAEPSEVCVECLLCGQQAVDLNLPRHTNAGWRGGHWAQPVKDRSLRRKVGPQRGEGGSHCGGCRRRSPLVRGRWWGSLLGLFPAMPGYLGKGLSIRAPAATSPQHRCGGPRSLIVPTQP